jgi:hypothetical protein
MSIDLITSGRVDLTAYAGRQGFLRGARLDKSHRYYQHGVCVDFLDMDWNAPAPEALLEAAKRHRPRYTVAGDYLRDSNNIGRVNERAERLREYADNVIVVPKSPGDLRCVPEWCVVGYSVPTEYGGTDIPLREYRDISQQIHVLGGTPPRQFEIIGKLWVDAVYSVDGYSIHKAATIGAKSWHPGTPHWRKLCGPYAVERAYCLSVRNLIRAYRSRGIVT